MPLEVDWSGAMPEAGACCKSMHAALSFACDQHKDPFECADAVMIYNEIFDEYGIPVHDGGPSYVVIAHCPWCGTKLPESQREQWFDAVDALGLDDSADVPAPYRSAQWRKGR